MRTGSGPKRWNMGRYGIRRMFRLDGAIFQWPLGLDFAMGMDLGGHGSMGLRAISLRAVGTQGRAGDGFRVRWGSAYLFAG